MKKMSRVEKSVLEFMAGTWGRWTRAVAGATLVVLGIIGGGWSLLLLLPGVLMIATGVMNYCPAGLFITGSGKSESILADIAKFDALGSNVNKH
jgi:hypothetical protein